MPRQHSFHAVFLVKVPATCCCPKRQKVIYDKRPRHVSPPPYFRLQKLFQTEICWRSLSPDCDTSAQFTFLSSITGWVQPHRLPFYSHTKKKKEQKTERDRRRSPGTRPASKQRRWEEIHPRRRVQPESLLKPCCSDRIWNNNSQKVLRQFPFHLSRDKEIHIH